MKRQGIRGAKEKPPGAARPLHLLWRQELGKCALQALVSLREVEAGMRRSARLLPALLFSASSWAPLQSAPWGLRGEAVRQGTWTCGTILLINDSSGC